MKNSKWFIMSILMILYACGSVEKENFLPTKIENQYYFVAERANPTDRHTLDRVVSNLPNGNLTRMLQLDLGHYLKVNKDSLKVDLPYFGRAYRSKYGEKDGGFKFETDKFSVFKLQTPQKITYKIVPNKEKNIHQIILEVYQDNRRASVYIYSNDRQPISYDGFLE